MIVTQGFEERSLGILEDLAKNNVRIPRVVINRYASKKDDNTNDKYQARFETAAEKVSPGNWRIVENDLDGHWVHAALKHIGTDEVIFDITAISNRGLFSALDSIANSGRRVYIAYTEANEYWPKEAGWKQLSKELSGHQTLAELIDAKPWLSGHAHRVELIPGHEGYDSVGSGRALIGFLPFKCARLAAVLGEEDYEEFLFIVGKPRLRKNLWRLTALKKINENLTKSWPIKTMGTFGHRKTLTQLSNLLFQDNSLLAQYNVHLAIMGSKLQTVGCWILSSLVPSITIVTSVPSRYYPEAFSDGVGAKWIFPLLPPKTIDDL